MAGRGPAIHVVLVCVSQKTWVAGPRPAMTVGETYGSSSMRFGMSPALSGSSCTLRERYCNGCYHALVGGPIVAVSGSVASVP
jgi:hypothetical protein